MSVWGAVLNNPTYGALVCTTEKRLNWWIRSLSLGLKPSRASLLLREGCRYSPTISWPAKPEHKLHTTTLEAVNSKTQAELWVEWERLCKWQNMILAIPSLCSGVMCNLRSHLGRRIVCPLLLTPHCSGSMMLWMILTGFVQSSFDRKASGTRCCCNAGRRNASESESLFLLTKIPRSAWSSLGCRLSRSMAEAHLLQGRLKALSNPKSCSSMYAPRCGWCSSLSRLSVSLLYKDMCSSSFRRYMFFAHGSLMRASAAVSRRDESPRWSASFARQIRASPVIFGAWTRR